ncbi:hypothetical protein EVAR_18663_1 [Eumeta japonica]|uniref:Uncharacterized protein n=1 Tax=Eumeta variegata TaxID=151549 RepID=A0A4C1U6M4_EUMVA|nr:hypothetical protein EVAR_18663_1 [Eumeta japonica]
MTDAARRDRSRGLPLRFYERPSGFKINVISRHCALAFVSKLVVTPGLKANLLPLSDRRSPCELQRRLRGMKSRGRSKENDTQSNVMSALLMLVDRAQET